jgi:hypothetical protein
VQLILAICFIWWTGCSFKVIRLLTVVGSGESKVRVGHLAMPSPGTPLPKTGHFYFALTTANKWLAIEFA